MEQVTAQMRRELASLSAKAPYSEDVLGTVSDYRIMLGLQYLRYLGAQAGVLSPLEPVLSFPLGSNVVSLLESVRMYEALVTGKVYNFSESKDDEFEEEELGEGLSLIERIESPDGEIIYTAKPVEHVVFDIKTRLSVSHILQNTILHGTGRYANKTVRLSSSDSEKQKRLDMLDMPVPLLGKTGTANDFINAAFLGFAPGLDEKNESFMNVESGSAVGVYVGFDDNRQMVMKSTHLTGAVGALPVWSSIVQGLYDSNKAGDRVDDIDMTFNGLTLQYPDAGQVFTAVDPERGGMVLPTQSIVDKGLARSIPSILTFGHSGADGVFEADRYFKPFWQNQ
jgi:membrane peptidoglycan carboxypeptidase